MLDMPGLTCQATETSSGEKRGKGRPRKDPENAMPAKPKPATTTPGRGRGRPRNDPASATPTKPATPGRGRGRPPKDPSEKSSSCSWSGGLSTDTGIESTPAKSTPTGGKRGRPKKNPETNGVDASGEGESTGAKKPESPAKLEYEADEDGRHYWLMKAEPESRLEKGVDVKFSIDDLKAATEPEPWDGM